MLWECLEKVTHILPKGGEKWWFTMVKIRKTSPTDSTNPRNCFNDSYRSSKRQPKKTGVGPLTHDVSIQCQGTGYMQAYMKTTKNPLKLWPFEWLIFMVKKSK